jgi:hypothetical protein
VPNIGKGNRQVTPKNSRKKVFWGRKCLRRNRMRKSLK